jgi:hypothetical protein
MHRCSLNAPGYTCVCVRVCVRVCDKTPIGFNQHLKSYSNSCDNNFPTGLLIVNYYVYIGQCVNSESNKIKFQVSVTSAAVMQYLQQFNVGSWHSSLLLGSSAIPSKISTVSFLLLLATVDVTVSLEYCYVHILC